tara:strand:+ start:335 stop:1603 length:1269 start_codon:yes stop_codon:yes gene_type:complete
MDSNDSKDNNLTDIKSFIKIKKKRGRKPKPKTEEDLKPKIKKKRGRKPKPKTVEDLKPKIKKKRGRKPKPKTAEDLKPKIPKKRGRKPKNKNYGLLNSNSKQQVNIDNKNIIIHLPINSNKIQENIGEKILLKYNPVMNIPQEYEATKIAGIPKESIKWLKSNTENKKTFNNNDLKSTDESDDELILTDDIKIKHIEEWYDINTLTTENNEITYNEIINDIKKTYKQNKKNYKSPENKTYNTLTQFKDGNKNMKWPTKTSVYCFWDCHPFSNIPIAIPTKIENGVYHLYGCFCSLECAAAYIFETYENPWEKYSLLHLLYNKTTNIKIAPSKQVLNIFGGAININNFRNMNAIKNINYKIIMPPFLSIIPMQKEVIINNKYNYIPVDKQKLNKADESLRLKRKMPINKNTLETCMNLKYQSN